MKVHHHKYAIILISAAFVVVFPVLLHVIWALISKKHQHSGDTERILWSIKEKPTFQNSFPKQFSTKRTINYNSNSNCFYNWIFCVFLDFILKIKRLFSRLKSLGYLHFYIIRYSGCVKDYVISTFSNCSVFSSFFDHFPKKLQRYSFSILQALYIFSFRKCKFRLWLFCTMLHW